MHRTRRLTGLVAVTAVAVVVPLAAQGADLTIESSAFVERVDAGTLTLATDGGDTLTLTYADAAGDVVTEEGPVTLRNREKCQLPVGDFTLLDIAVTGGDVGLVSNGLGSRESNNCASSNGRLSVGQTLTLTLGDGLPANVRVDDATLDLEGKFGADARVVTRRGTTDTGEFVVDLDGDASDNGADAAEADNTYAPIGVADDGSDDFTVLELFVVDTDGDGRDEVALEGGGDWPVPAAHRTVLNLVALTGYEYALDCGDTLTDPLGDTGTALDATLTRYGTADASGEAGSCDPIGADLSSDSDGVLFRKTLVDAQGDAQAPTTRLQLTWRVELYELDADGNRVLDTEGNPVARPASDVEDELQRQIDLLPDDPTNPEPNVEFCLADNDPIGADPLDPTTAVPADHPADTPWCLLDETIDLRDGYLFQTQVYDGWGDPRFF